MNGFCQIHSCHHPDTTCEEIDRIVLNPTLWLELKKKARKRFNSLSYLVTFTRNPNSRYNKKEWLRRVVQELRKAYITDVACSLEHIETNIHCHAVVSTNKAVAKSAYKVFNRDYGYVDLRRINVDNGVVNYIEKDLAKDLTSFSPEELRNKYIDII